MAKKNDLPMRAKALGFRSGFEMQVADEMNYLSWKYEYEHPVYCCFNYYKTVRNGKVLGSDGNLKQAVKGEKVVQLCTYTVDFAILNNTNKPWYIETKGYFKPADMAKHRRILEQYPKADVRLLFQYNHKIPGKKGMRYSDWCDINGATYGFVRNLGKGQFKFIPEDWL